MKAETFLADLNARYRGAGGPSLDLLARHIAEALEEISEGAETDPLEGMLKEKLLELAEERGIEVVGTGTDGAILKADLIKALR